jgi:hypothetical protein
MTNTILPSDNTLFSSPINMEEFDTEQVRSED